MEYSELNNRRRIDRPAIRRCCEDDVSSDPKAGGKHLHLGPEPHALAFSGCWTTSRLYVMRLRSMVYLECSLLVSLGGCVILYLEPPIEYVLMGAPSR